MAAASSESIRTEEMGSGNPRRPLLTSHWSELGHKLILNQSWTREVRIISSAKGSTPGAASPQRHTSQLGEG